MAIAPLSRRHTTVFLGRGGALAAAGSALLATTCSVTLALVGLLLVSASTATIFSTLLSRNLRGLGAAEHGRATSAVVAAGYLVFLVGPAYVGALAEAFGLRAAILSVAALALVFTLTAAPISTRAAYHTGPAASRAEP